MKRALALLLGTSYGTLFRRVVAASLLLHLAVAWFSEGFYHCDEHYQIVEFASAKAGRTPFANLPWEFREHIRPWFQPALYYPFIRGLFGLGIEDPFVVAWILRALTAVLAWSALVTFTRCLPRFLADGPVRRWTLLALHFFYFVPILAARTSSENFAQIFVLFALAALIQPGRLGRSFYPTSNVTEAASDSTGEPHGFEPAGLLAGAAFGFSFLARYQALALIAGAGLWFVLYGRRRWSFLLQTGVGFLAAVALGIVLDRWGYGQWVFPPWDYFRVNVLEGMASKFGRSPPWGFFPLYSGAFVPPFGLLWLCVLLAAIPLLPRHLLTFTTAPFLLVHFALAHKETRFLFPTLTLAIVLAGLLLARFRTRAGTATSARHDRGRRLARAFGLVLAVANVAGLLFVSFAPTSPRWTILRELDRLAPDGYTLFTGNGYDAITRCGNDPVFYAGKRRWAQYDGEALRETDSRSLPAFYAWAGNPLSVRENPFAATCQELLPSFWLSSPSAQKAWREYVPRSVAKGVRVYAVYGCGDR